MKHQSILRASLLTASSVVALIAAPAALAQDAAPADSPEADIVVTGFRQSLATALAAKRRSTLIIESITAEDIGKFPDQNITESLQRLPGIQIDRENGQGTKVRIRGLDQNVTVLNGETFVTGLEIFKVGEGKRLAEVALDGLPRRVSVKVAPLFSDYADEFWTDYARHWKGSTQKRNLDAINRDLMPRFGKMRIDLIGKSDVVRWRDDCANVSEGKFNRAVPVLAAMFKYAAQLGYIRKGSNPCRGMPRFKTKPKERYLSPQEFRRLARELDADEATYPAQVAAARLLIFTGARLGEIRDLEWDWVHLPRLLLPDSKTGPKTIWLNSQAVKIVEGIERREDSKFVFANQSGLRPVNMDNWWFPFRKRCALPDVRIHDLRHSFASVAIREKVPLATIGGLLGHLLPETTARYAHLADETIADAASRVSSGIAGSLGLSA